MSVQNNPISLNQQVVDQNQGNKLKKNESSMAASVSTASMVDSVKRANGGIQVEKPKPVVMPSITISPIGVQSIRAEKNKPGDGNLSASLLQEGRKIFPEEAMRYLQEINQLNGQQLNRRIKEQRQLGVDLIGRSLKIVNSDKQVRNSKESAKEVLFLSRALVSKLKADPTYSKRARVELDRIVHMTQKIYATFPMDYNEAVDYLSPLVSQDLFDREFARNKEKLVTAIFFFMDEKTRHPSEDSIISAVAIEKYLDTALKKDSSEGNKPLETELSEKLKKRKEIFSEQGLKYLKEIDLLTPQQLNKKIKEQRQQGIDLIAHCLKVANENPEIAYDKEEAKDALAYSKSIVSKLKTDPTYSKKARLELDRIVQTTQKIYDSFPVIYKVVSTKGKTQAKNEESKISDKKESEAIITSRHKLQDGRSLITFNTTGDGSCGLHAMIGKVEGASKTYKCNAREVRKEFCQWLKSTHILNELPSNIDNVLTDYFLNFDLSPPEFQKMTAELHAKYFAGYHTLSKKERDLQAQNFIRDPEVFDAYLQQLEKIGTYLLQDELEAVAIHLNKKVYLYQAGWGFDSNKVACNILNPEGQEEVHIWFRPNHYERAKVINK